MTFQSWVEAQTENQEARDLLYWRVGWLMGWPVAAAARERAPPPPQASLRTQPRPPLLPTAFLVGCRVYPRAELGGFNAGAVSVLEVARIEATMLAGKSEAAMFYGAAAQFVDKLAAVGAAGCGRLPVGLGAGRAAGGCRSRGWPAAPAPGSPPASLRSRPRPAPTRRRSRSWAAAS